MENTILVQKINAPLNYVIVFRTTKKTFSKNRKTENIKVDLNTSRFFNSSSDVFLKYHF